MVESRCTKILKSFVDGCVEKRFVDNRVEVNEFFEKLC